MMKIRARECFMQKRSCALKHPKPIKSANVRMINKKEARTPITRQRCVASWIFSQVVGRKALIGEGHNLVKSIGKQRDGRVKSGGVTDLSKSRSMSVAPTGSGRLLGRSQ